MTPPLSCLNYMNVIAYVANVAVTYGIGVLGVAGTPTNSELSEKYQTLVTPIGFAFSIWGIIFVAQLFFTIVQLLPSFRASPLVAGAIGYDYVAVCISQIAWTLSFTYEIIWLSFASMLAILYFLLTLINDEYKEKPSSSPIRDYWLLKFPFSVHTGWIIAASFVNLSVFLVDRGISADVQFYTAIGTLVALVLVSSFSVSFPARPEYAIPFVLAWASFGIFSELSNPKDTIVATFAQERIDWLRTGALVAMTLILVAIVLKFVLKCVKKRNAPAATEDEESGYTRIEDSEAGPRTASKSRASATTKATSDADTLAPSLVSGISDNS